MTEEELTRRAKKRSSLRFDYPGLSTLNFEIILSIVLKEIVGWNNKKGGIFGIPKAYFYSVEEQAKKTLHVHMLIWIENLPYKRDDLEKDISSSSFKKAVLGLKKYINKTQSCSLIDKNKHLISHCCKDKIKRNPIIKSNQELRFIRHKEGCVVQKNTIAYCLKCNKEWSADALALSYVTVSLKLCAIQHNSMIDNQSIIIDEFDKQIVKHKRKYLNELIFQNKFPNMKDNIDLKCITNAYYNVHSSQHV
jgi:hypothetical protein